MEQHPIPQDVTGFQFKLIGTMTVKQFGYVAAGAILAVLSWYAPVQGFLWHFVTKGILVPIFGLSGVIIAFVPIEGRPVDIMTTNFFHALFSPNQYVYIKKGRKFSFTQISYAKAPPAKATTAVQKSTSQVFQESKKGQQLRALLASSYQNTKNTLDKKEVAFLQSIAAMPTPTPQPILTAAPVTIKTPTKPTLHFPVSSPKSGAALHPAHPGALLHPANIVTSQTQIPPKPKPVLLQHQLVKQTPAQDLAHARNIPQNMTKSAGFPHVSDTPNVVVGIVKDSRGNSLPNILVEVKDKDGNPVRAFKTNPLGQFASATPLADGTYAIELEDPKKQHAFGIIQINANKQIMLPIEIISHDAREELHKQLFN